MSKKLSPKPNHRYVTVEPYDLQEDARDADSKFEGFIIPEDFHASRHEMEPTELMRVKHVGPECTTSLKEGQVVLVETRMLENRATPLGNVIWISENYIPIKFE